MSMKNTTVMQQPTDKYARIFGSNTKLAKKFQRIAQDPVRLYEGYDEVNIPVIKAVRLG